MHRFPRFAALVLAAALLLPSLAGAADLNTRISLDFRDADIRDIFKLAAEKGGYGLVVDKSVRGNLTLRLLDVPLLRALDTIAMATGFEWFLVDNNVVLCDGHRLPISSTVRPLGHIDADEAAKVLLIAIKKDIKVATTSGNSLVLTARQPILKEAERILAGIDKPRRQFTAILQVMEEGKPVHALEFKALPGSETKLFQGTQIVYPKGADQPPAKMDVGLRGHLETAIRPGSDLLEGRLDLDLSWVEKFEGSFPLVARRKLQTFWHGQAGKALKLGAFDGNREVLLTFTWDQ